MEDNLHPCTYCSGLVGNAHKCKICNGYVHVFHGTGDSEEEGYGQSLVCFKCSPPKSNNRSSERHQEQQEPKLKTQPKQVSLFSSKLKSGCKRPWNDGSAVQKLSDLKQTKFIFGKQKYPHPDTRPKTQQNASAKENNEFLCLKCHSLLKFNKTWYIQRHWSQKHQGEDVQNSSKYVVYIDHEEAKKIIKSKEFIKSSKNDIVVPDKSKDNCKNAEPSVQLNVNHEGEAPLESLNTLKIPTNDKEKYCTSMTQKTLYSMFKDKEDNTNFENKEIAETANSSFGDEINLEDTEYQPSFTPSCQEFTEYFRKNEALLTSIRTDLNQLNIKMEALDLGSKRKTENCGEGASSYFKSSVSSANNLNEVIHQNILISKTVEGCEVTCFLCKRYLDSLPFGKRGCESSFAKGLQYDVKTTEKLCCGSNQVWFSFKKNLLDHLQCNAIRAGGQFQHQAKIFEINTERREKQILDKNSRVVAAAIQTCKMKSAAISFESLLGFLSFCKTDIGNIGHGRKLFPEIIHTAYTYITKKLAEHLKSVLPSTGLPPHFSLAADKSTPHRDTNQAIVLIIPSDGKRVAVPLDAPVVYGIDENKGIMGGTGRDLADQIFQTLEDRMKFSKEDLSFIHWVLSVSLLTYLLTYLSFIRG